MAYKVVGFLYATRTNAGGTSLGGTLGKSPYPFGRIKRSTLFGLTRNDEPAFYFLKYVNHCFLDNKFLKVSSNHYRIVIRHINRIGIFGDGYSLGNRYVFVHKNIIDL